jgi:hypothetical protein
MKARKILSHLDKISIMKMFREIFERFESMIVCS